METTNMESAFGRKVYENPVIGDKIVFLETSAETNGARTLIFLELAKGGGNTAHIHEGYSETFEPVEGELRVRIGEEFKTLKPGEKITVPPRTKHYFQNPTDGQIKFKVLLEPGQEGFEQSLKIAYGLAKDGLTDKNSIPKKFSYLALLVILGGTVPTGFLSLLMPVFRWKARQARKKGVLKALLEKYS